MGNQKAFSSAAALARWVVDESLLFNDVESPFRAAISGRAAKLVIVTGENASGKSLYVRVAAAAFKECSGGLPVSISIRERTGAGSHEVSGLRRIMMFGDEQEQSTGATSVKTLQTAFRNLDRPQGSLLIVDEPELGLSEAYARALGEYIGREVPGVPKSCIGVVVVTHSKPLVEGLVKSFGRAPTHVAVAAEHPAEAGLDVWLSGVEHRSIEELLSLQEVGLERWRRVSAIVKS